MNINYSVMKTIVLLICAAAFLQCYALGRPDPKLDGIMGVSQKQLQEYLTKAIEGFRKIMPNGDDQMDYPIMDPYPLEESSWDYVDTSDSKKYKVNLSITKSTVIKGLSNFKVSDVQANAKDMNLFFQITFQNLETEFPYKLDGYLLKNFLPIWGEGIVKLSAQKFKMHCSVDLNVDQGHIVVEHATASSWFKNDINIQATGFMDFPQPFGDLVLDDIMYNVMDKHMKTILRNFVQNMVEEAVGGMTTQELFDYLDYFVKKTDQQ